MNPSTLPKVTSLPYIDLQPDFASVNVSQSVVRSEEFWVSGYWQGKKSVHGKIRCSMDDDGDLKITTSGGVVLGPIGEDSSTPLKISFPSLGIPPTTVRRPRQTIRPSKTSAFPKSLNSFSLSSSQPLLALAGDNGALLVVPTANTSSSSAAPPPLALKEAIGDVLSTNFFPSGTVTISTTLTSTLLIHSALPTASNATSPSNAPARVLKAHTRPVTCSAILGRGKNVLSGSKDRTVKRWDVGKAEVVGSVEFGDEIWCLAGEVPVGEGEEAETKAVWVGLKSGGVWRVDTGGEGTLKNSGVGIEGGKEGGVNAIAVSTTLLATATESGTLSIYSLPTFSSSSPPTLLAKVRRSPGAINSLAFLPDSRLLVGGEDGMPWIAASDIHQQSIEEGGEVTWGVSEELAGWEDPIVCVRVGEGKKEGEVWIGSGKEGVGRY